MESELTIQVEIVHVINNKNYILVILDANSNEQINDIRKAIKECNCIIHKAELIKRPSIFSYGIAKYSILVPEEQIKKFNKLICS